MTELVSFSTSASTTQQSSRYVGSLVGLAGNVVHGWAIDTEDRAASVVVEILADGESIGVTVANQFCSHEAENGHSVHGFSFTLPAAILRRTNYVAARVANQLVTLGAAIALPGQQSSDAGQLTSELWYDGSLIITGWIIDPSAPGRQLAVQARHGQQVVATTSANRPHSALNTSISFEHGFHLSLPIALADGTPRQIHIETDSGQHIPGSPITVCCYANDIGRKLQSLGAEAARHDPSLKKQLDALAALIRAQDRLNPVSVGFNQYEHWFALSEAAHAEVTTKSTSTHQAAIIILGEAGHDLDRSLASTAVQHLRPLSVAHHAGDLRAAIMDAAAQGADLLVGMEAGDRLAPSYLSRIAELFAHPDVRFAYSDCDQDGPKGERTNPWLKPCWDPDLFLGSDLVTPGCAWSTQYLCEALLARPDLDIPDWQTVSMLLAGSGLLDDDTDAVRHLPAVLYHRRATAPALPYERARSTSCMQLLAQVVHDQDDKALVSVNTQYPGITRVEWQLPVAAPSVSLIVPTRDEYRLLKACIDGLLHRTTYPGKVEIIVVDNNSSDIETLQYMADIAQQGVRVLRYPKEFNYSDINNFAVSHATGDVIGLINNDIDVIHDDWLSEMVAQLCRPNVGAVGAKLLWPNNLVQHGGVVVGMIGLALHTGTNWLNGDAGYLGLNQLTRRQSAVTAACLMIKKHDYESLGGLDSLLFPVTFNNVDLCLRLRERELNILWTPHARLMHAESASRDKEDTPTKKARALREQFSFMAKWSKSDWSDDFYNPGLSRSSVTGPYNGLALP